MTETERFSFMRFHGSKVSFWQTKTIGMQLVRNKDIPSQALKNNDEVGKVGYYVCYMTPNRMGLEVRPTRYWPQFGLAVFCLFIG